ncbi:MAG: hypothetical protein WB815_10260 [Nitrososphaeraceae archaeon]
MTAKLVPENLNHFSDDIFKVSTRSEDSERKGSYYRKNVDISIFLYFL